MAGKLSGCRLSRRKSMSVITLHHAKKKKGIVISPVFNAFSSAQAPPGLRLDAEDFHDGLQYVSVCILITRSSDRYVLAVSVYSEILTAIFCMLTAGLQHNFAGLSQRLNFAFQAVINTLHVVVCGRSAFSFQYQPNMAYATMTHRKNSVSFCWC